MTTRNPRRMAALLATLVLAAASAVVSAGPATAGESANSAGVAVEANDPITVDDLHNLVAQFEGTGEVTFAGARRMEVLLVLAQQSIDRRTPTLAIHSLELFKDVASTPRYVPSTAARDELIAAADQLIAQLSVTP